MPRRTVLVTGASGLVGTWLLRTAPDDVDVVALVHRTGVDGVRTVTADLRDGAAVGAAVTAAEPDLVLHAAMAVDEASIVDASRHVAAAAAAAGSGLVLTSTDAVFGGGGRLADEVAPPDPVWDYGRWKVEAEAACAAAVPSAALVRLPLVVSLDPPDAAVRRVRDEAADGRVSTWFDDEIRQPARAEELAEALWAIASLPDAERGGVWHLVGPERLTRFEIAQRIAGALGLDASVVGGEPTRPGLDRPRDLHLGSERAAAAIGWDPRPILR